MRVECLECGKPIEINKNTVMLTYDGEFVECPNCKKIFDMQAYHMHGKLVEQEEKMIDHTLETINRNVRAMAKLRGLTDTELCERVGVTRGYFEREREDLGILRLLKTAQILDIEPQKLWDEEFTEEVRRMALRCEIERLTKELNALENGCGADAIMEEPVEDTPVKK